MKIFLIRHGEKEKIPGDPGLSELGKIQAQNTGEHLKSFKIDKIYVSPLKRTSETATYISQKLNLDFVIEKRLKERMNWGEANEQTFEEFMAEWKIADQNRDYKPNYGDSSKSAGERIEEVIKVLYENNQEKSIVLVTHGGVVADFLRNIFTNEELDKVKDNFSVLKDGLIKECSISALNYSEGKYNLESLALVDHLQAEE